MAVEVGEVGAFGGGVGGEGGGLREVKTEGETALELGFDRVTVGGDDLGSGSAGEGGQMLVEQFGGEGVGLVEAFEQLALPLFASLYNQAALWLTA
jgi:hypothetical protein